MRRHLLALMVASTTPAVLAAQTPAGAPQPASAIPASAIGDIAHALLDAVSSGDSAVIDRFVAERLGHDVRGRSPATLARMIRKLHAQSGGLRLERARMAGRDLRLMAEARNGRRWVGIEIEPATGDSTRGSIMFYPTDNPGITGPPTPWATTALTDAQVATLVRERVKAAADSDRFSGVVLVARGDDVLVFDAHGYADRARDRLNTRETRFPTYSLGKMLTGVAIAQLVAEGKLGWADTVARVLPSYPNREVAERITVAQLLTHTAGVPEPFASKRFAEADKSGSNESLLATFADAPQSPGAGTFHYSNGNYLTLAAIVERASGLTYDEYVRRHVWAPSGVALSTSEPAVGYAQFAEDDPLGIEPRTPSRTAAQGAGGKPLGFGGGTYAAGELYRFARALRTGRLVPAAIADSIVAPRVGMGGTMKYGYGFYSRTMHGTQVLGHSGSNPSTGYDADLQMVWAGEWTVIVLSNYDAPAGMMIMMPILDLLARQVALRR